MVEPSARFEDIRIPLREPVHGLDSVSGVLGIPEWWPTGSRVAVVLAHASARDQNEPMLVALHRELTERKYLTLRFNFPFAEAGKRSSADSAEAMEMAFRSAVAVLGRDPASAPAHLFLGGVGLGARVCAQLARERLRLDGLIFLSFPLHSQDRPEKTHNEDLYRIISPMLFVQGTRDRQCDIDTLKQTLGRVGAPTSLHITSEADQNFHVPKKSVRSNDDVQAEVIQTVATWIEKQLGTA
ncbi:MAG: hypothetical protein MJE66_04030 [Proteobacteria bacterium]|nr:hypothetical protein [Pseudomonadota bacterium]